MKQLDTLPADIDQLFFEGKIVNEENLNSFLKGLGDLLRERLKPKEETAPTIRMSKLGIKDRKLWFEHNVILPKSKATNSLKFIYGDIIEQLIIFLAKEAGHTVEDEQKEIIIDGILGHQDAKIDGITVDIKSASDYAFKKFSERQLFKDDPFGYIAQLSAYAGNNKAAFIGVNKVTGQICLLDLAPIDRIDPVKRIAHVKKLVVQPEPPKEKCYEAVPYKASNNMTLNKNCGYCQFKDLCWKDANGGIGLRYFDYSTGPVPMVKVVDEPRVNELFPNDLSVGETVGSVEEVLN